MNSRVKQTTCTVSEFNTDVFAHLTPQEIELINQNMVNVRYNKGESICKTGTLAPYIIFVREGLAKVFLEGCSESLVLKIIPPNNFIALTAVLEGNTVFPYSASAYKRTEASLIDINVVRQIIQQNGLFAASIINILCSNSQQIFGRFYCLTNKQLYGRMADIILCLTERIFKQPSFELDLSRSELAELTKMSTESVIRMLKKFKDENIISIEGKTFTVLNFEKLRSISEYG